MLNNIQLKKFPQQYFDLPIADEAGHTFVSRLSDGKGFRVTIARLAEIIGIDAVGAKPIRVTGSAMPSVNNDGAPLVKGDWAFLTSGTYTNIAGGANVVVPPNSLGISIFTSPSWGTPAIISFPDNSSKMVPHVPGSTVELNGVRTVGKTIFRANKVTTQPPLNAQGKLNPDWDRIGDAEMDVVGGALSYSAALSGQIVSDIPTPYEGQFWRGDGTVGGFDWYLRSDKFDLKKGETVSVRSMTEFEGNPGILVFDKASGRYLPEESVYYKALNTLETLTYTAAAPRVIAINYRREPLAGMFKNLVQSLFVKPSDIDSTTSPIAVASKKSVDDIKKNSSTRQLTNITLINKGMLIPGGTYNFEAIEWRYTDPIPVKAGDSLTARTRFEEPAATGALMGFILDKNYNWLADLKIQKRIEPIDDLNRRYESTYVAAVDSFVVIASHTRNPNDPVLFVEALGEQPIFLEPSNIGEKSDFGVASQIEFDKFKNNGGQTVLPFSIFSYPGVIKPDGDTTALPSMRYTDFIELKKGQTLNASVAIDAFDPLAPGVLMFVYDNTKTIIMEKVFATGLGLQNISYTASETVYIRLNHFIAGFPFKQHVSISLPRIYMPADGGGGAGGGGTGRHIPNVTEHNPTNMIIIELDSTDPIPSTKGQYMKGNTKIIIDHLEFNFYCRFEPQGSSSLNYPEKNWTIGFFTDATMVTKKPFRLANLLPHDEYVMKANWIDPNHVCNIVCNRVWEQMLRTRDSFPKRDTDQRLWVTPPGADAMETGALGHVDGYPCALYKSGVFYGIGTFNIGKKYQNYDLTKDDPAHTQFELGDAVDYTILNGIELRNPKVKTPAVDEVLNKFKALASMDISVNKQAFKDGFVQNNIVDMYLLLDVFKLVDCISRNTIWMTYNAGAKFLATPYDLDSWYKSANGGEIAPTTGRVWDNGLNVPANTIDFWANKVGVVFDAEIKARYAQLRSTGIFSADNIYDLARELSLKFTREMYQKDIARWPEKSVFSMGILKIADWIRARLIYCDGVYGY